MWFTRALFALAVCGTSLGAQSPAPLRPSWDDFAGSWELLLWPNGSHTGPVDGQKPRVGRVQLTLVPAVALDVRPSFRGHVADLAGMRGLDSLPLHQVLLQYETRDSVLVFLGRLRDSVSINGGTPSLWINGTPSGDSLVGLWSSGGHAMPLHRGRAVLRRAPEPDRPTPARPLPGVESFTILAAESELTFRGLPGAVVRSDGRVVLNDLPGRRVIVLDSTLALESTVFDAASPAPLTYPRSSPSLHLGRGDSVYVVDGSASVMRVIGPDGQVSRFQPIADREDAGRMNNRFSGTQIGDRVMYFTATLVPRRAGEFSAEPRDSMYVVRVNTATAKRDTVGIVTTRVLSKSVPADSIAGELRGVVSLYRPFEEGDAIALTPRGELAVIRGSDFHVDWLRPDGTWRRSAPAQWHWQRLSPVQKDSVTRQVNAFLNSGSVFSVVPLGAPRPRIERQVSRVPDFVPAFVPMSAIADPKGLVWVQLGARRGTSGPQPPTHAGIDSTGQIVRIIRLPQDRRLIGFDRNGRAYVIAPGPGIRVEVFRP